MGGNFNIVSGYFTNIMITVFSCLIPAGIGFLFVFLTGKVKAAYKPVKIVGYVFESISPVILLLVFFYCVFPSSRSRILISVLAFSVAFLGYIPSKIKREYSIGKNFLVNLIGLFAYVMKWSFCVHFVAITDLLGSIIRNSQRSYDFKLLWVGLLISLPIIVGLHILKFVLEEHMK